MTKKKTAANKIVIPYTPRPLQKEFHLNARRWNVAVCHRRFGKTVMAVNWLVRCLIECQHKNPQGMFIAPTFGQVEKIAFEYLKEATAVFPGVKFNAAKLRCEIPHTSLGKISIYLLSGSNESSENLRGMYADAVVLDEFADIPPKVFPQILRPALADRRGSCLWIGTPKAEDQFKATYDQGLAEVAAGNPDWYVCLFPASKTNVLPQAEIEELKSQMSDNEYRQELECDWSANLTGAYYADHLNKAEAEQRIGNVPYDETMLVNTSWDLGVRDMTSIALATIFIVVTGFARQATLSPVGIHQKYQGE